MPLLLEWSKRALADIDEIGKCRAELNYLTAQIEKAQSYVYELVF